jgi:nucleoside-diphosphate-sugar epimerase
MKALVTGSAGFIGKHLCRTLVSQGHQVLEWDRQGPAGYLASQDLHCLRGSILSRFHSDVAQADQVFHLAGTADVQAFDTDPGLFGRDLTMAAFVMACANNYDKPIVVVSSAYANGCTTTYGRCKRGIEEVCALARQSGLLVSTARIFNIYGPGQERAVTYKSAVVLNLYRAFKRGEWRLKNPRAKRDFVYIDDAIEGLIDLMGATAAGNPAQRDIASGELIEVQVLACEMAALMGHTMPLDWPEHEVKEVPPYSAPGNPPAYPRIGLSEGLRRTVAHLEETGV